MTPASLSSHSINRLIPSQRAFQKYLNTCESKRLYEMYQRFLPGKLALSEGSYDYEHDIVSSFQWFDVPIKGISFIPVGHYLLIQDDLRSGKSWNYFWNQQYYPRLAPSILDHGHTYDRCRTLVDRLVGPTWPARPFSETLLHEMTSARGEEFIFNWLGYSLGMMVSEHLIHFTLMTVTEWDECASAISAQLMAFARGHYILHIADDNTCLMLCSRLPTKQ